MLRRQIMLPSTTSDSHGHATSVRFCFQTSFLEPTLFAPMRARETLIDTRSRMNFWLETWARAAEYHRLDCMADRHDDYKVTYGNEASESGGGRSRWLHGHETTTERARSMWIPRRQTSESPHLSSRQPMTLTRRVLHGREIATRIPDNPSPVFTEDHGHSQREAARTSSGLHHEDEHVGVDRWSCTSQAGMRTEPQGALDHASLAPFSPVRRARSQRSSRMMSKQRPSVQCDATEEQRGLDLLALMVADKRLESSPTRPVSVQRAQRQLTYIMQMTREFCLRLHHSIQEQLAFDTEMKTLPRQSVTSATPKASEIASVAASAGSDAESHATNTSTKDDRQPMTEGAKRRQRIYLGLMLRRLERAEAKAAEKAELPLSPSAWDAKKRVHDPHHVSLDVSPSALSSGWHKLLRQLLRLGVRLTAEQFQDLKSSLRGWHDDYFQYGFGHQSSLTPLLPRRRGQWLEVEEQYIFQLVRAIQLHLVSFVQGQTPIAFLAERLHCDESRVRHKINKAPRITDLLELQQQWRQTPPPAAKPYNELTPDDHKVLEQLRTAQLQFLKFLERDVVRLLRSHLVIQYRERAKTHAMAA